MAKETILMFVVLYFINVWTFGVDSKLVHLDLHGQNENKPLKNIFMDTAIPLDMAPNSVDDYYKGCIDKMRKKVERDYLTKERTNDKDFDEAWATAENSIIPKKIKFNSKFKKNDYVALQVYVNARANIYKSFNEATRTEKMTYETFKYLSLHFFLTNTIQYLNTKKLITAYRGTNVSFEINNCTIRFGQFTSSSESQYIAKRFGTRSCFEIKTYFGASIKKYSHLEHEKEVLIPPYEVFKITSVQRKEDNKSLWCDVVYKLESTKKKRSDLNCQMVR